MARDNKGRVPRIGEWVTFWYPEAQGLRACPAQILGRGRLNGYDVNVSKPGMQPRFMVGCEFGDEPKGRGLTWEAPSVLAGFIPEPKQVAEPVPV